MKLVYNQPFTNNRATKCWYGKPPKSIFKYDVIKLQLADAKDILWFTPDEAVDVIRALSSGVHHYLVDSDEHQYIIDSKSEAERKLNE